MSTIQTLVVPTDSGVISQELSPTQSSNDKSWEFRQYSAGATIPVLDNYGDDVAYKTLKTYLDSATSISMAIGDSYTARCTIWAYFSQDTPTSITVNSDDASTWYLDGVLISTVSKYNDAKTATWNFHSGWNKVQCVYTEGSGGDGWVMSPKLNTFAEKLTSTVDTYQFTATSNKKYKFNNWLKDGTEIITDNPYTQQVTQDLVLQANFKRINNKKIIIGS